MRRSSGLRLELKDTSAYIPKHEALYIKDDDGPGPFQKKPIGEHGAIPTAAAIANAVYDAIGTQIRDLPITAEKVYSVMLQKRMSHL
jgi:CO/xanthine dehydrogenase Mo-binding subunit